MPSMHVNASQSLYLANVKMPTLSRPSTGASVWFGSDQKRATLDCMKPHRPSHHLSGAPYIGPQGPWVMFRLARLAFQCPLGLVPHLVDLTKSRKRE
jgi:hypothetical protein